MTITATYRRCDSCDALRPARFTGARWLCHICWTALIAGGDAA